MALSKCTFENVRTTTAQARWTFGFLLQPRSLITGRTQSARITARNSSALIVTVPKKTVNSYLLLIDESGIRH